MENTVEIIKAAADALSASRLDECPATEVLIRMPGTGNDGTGTIMRAYCRATEKYTRDAYMEYVLDAYARQHCNYDRIEHISVLDHFLSIKDNEIWLRGTIFYKAEEVES